MRIFRLPYQLITMKHLASDGSELDLTDPSLKTMENQLILDSRFICKIEGINSHIIYKVELPTFKINGEDVAYATIYCREQKDVGQWADNELKNIVFGNNDFDRYKQWEITQEDDETKGLVE